MLVVIGQSEATSFGFGFATLDWKPLFPIFLEIFKIILKVNFNRVEDIQKPTDNMWNGIAKF